MASATTMELVIEESKNRVNDVTRRLMSLKKKKPKEESGNCAERNEEWREQKARYVKQLITAMKQWEEAKALQQAQDGDTNKRQRRQKLDTKSVPSFESRAICRDTATKGTVSRFLDRFKTIMVLHNIAEDEWAQYLHLAFPSGKLSDVEWLKEHATKNVSWEHIALLFVEYFAIDKTYASALRELRACTQESRPVSDYHLHFKQLAQETVPPGGHDDIDSLPMYNQMFEAGLRPEIRDGMLARDEYDDDALESLSRIADMARATEKKLLGRSGKNQIKEPPTKPKGKDRGTAPQYEHETCARCAKRHPGQCWAKWHKDGTELGPPITPRSKSKIAKIRLAHGLKVDNRRPSKHREVYSENEDLYSTDEDSE